MSVRPVSKFDELHEIIAKENNYCVFFTLGVLLVNFALVQRTWSLFL